MDFNASIWNKKQNLRSRGILYSIYQTTATMIRGLPHPVKIKLNHKPTATASQTVRVPSQFYISKSHGVQA